MPRRFVCRSDAPPHFPSLVTVMEDGRALASYCGEPLVWFDNIAELCSRLSIEPNDLVAEDETEAHE